MNCVIDIAFTHTHTHTHTHTRAGLGASTLHNRPVQCPLSSPPRVVAVNLIGCTAPKPARSSARCLVMKAVHDTLAHERTQKFVLCFA
jgi:hypothetical protein